MRIRARGIPGAASFGVALKMAVGHGLRFDTIGGQITMIPWLFRQLLTRMEIKSRWTLSTTAAHIEARAASRFTETFSIIMSRPRTHDIAAAPTCPAELS